jgi:exodeoxyribonuclease-3
VADEWWVSCGIDDQLATPALAAKAKAVSIYTDQKFSDHAPLVIDDGFTL